MKRDDLEDRNLWSQVLGEAVVGHRAGEKLAIVPSDIMQFSTWQNRFPNGRVLHTGGARDPYNGAYYDVAARFGPNFDPAISPLPPMEYVYGVVIDGVAKAYPRDLLPVGSFTDTIGDHEVIVSKNEFDIVSFKHFGNEKPLPLPDVEGFWFSWFAAHPDTELWQPNN